MTILVGNYNKIDNSIIFDDVKKKWKEVIYFYQRRKFEWLTYLCRFCQKTHLKSFHDIRFLLGRCNEIDASVIFDDVTSLKKGEMEIIYLFQWQKFGRLTDLCHFRRKICLQSFNDLPFFVGKFR